MQNQIKNYNKEKEGELKMEKKILTLEMVQNYLDQKGKEYKDYVVFECPICKKEGHDSNSHNLIFYPNKGGFLKCMRNDDKSHGAQIYYEIMNELGGEEDEK